MHAYQKEFIELSLKANALCFGEYTLKSGRVSPYFFNAGLFNTGVLLHGLGTCFAQTLKESGLEFDMIFGPAYKGIPLACTLANALATEYGEDIPIAFDRKEIKTHGEKSQLIGAPLQGKVLIIDDVITAGTAKREAIELIQSQGAQVAGVLIALDRQERGENTLSATQELEQHANIPVLSIVKLDQLYEFIQQSENYQPFLEPVQAYREEYGV